jgi:hypothetical protein
MANQHSESLKAGGGPNSSLPSRGPESVKRSKEHWDSRTGKGLSTEDQQYELTAANINEFRSYIDQWRVLPNSKDWLVTPETARLLQHWPGSAPPIHDLNENVCSTSNTLMCSAFVYILPLWTADG